MQIIGRKLKPRSRLVYPSDQLMLSLLHNAVYGCDYLGVSPNLPFDVLHALGLMIRSRDGAYGPTHLLLSCFASGYPRRQEATSSEQRPTLTKH